MLLQILAQTAGRGEALQSGSADKKQVCDLSRIDAIDGFSMLSMG